MIPFDFIPLFRFQYSFGESFKMWWDIIIPHIIGLLFTIIIIVIVLQFIVKIIRKGLFGAIKDIRKEIKDNHNDYQK